MNPRGYGVFFVIFNLIFVSLAKPGELHDLRLDANVYPRSQTIVLNLDPGKPDYSGSTQIELQVERATTTFRFHAQSMTLNKIILTGKNGEIPVQTEEGGEGIRYLTAARELSPGAYSLKINFSKPFNTKGIGLYRVESEGMSYLFTQFQAVDARRAFPCWDEPQYKIPFQMTFKIPEENVALTNTPLQSETITDGLKTLTFAQTKPLPTYLLAIIAGPLDSVPVSDVSVPCRIYTVKGQSHLTGVASEIVGPTLAAIEAFFDSKYPFKKLDLIAVPEYWPGAMENPGAITFADRILLVGSSDDVTLRQRRTLEYVMAHEVAHMWFGDFVTMQWWNDLWLNESFATWLGEKIANRLYQESRHDLNRFHSKNSMLNQDARPSTRPIRRNVITGADINEDAGLAYGKGSKVLEMVEMWLGEENVRRGVIQYMKENAWANATADDLWNNLAKASGKNVKPVLASFIEQPSFPLIEVSAIRDGKVTISQRRFMNYGVEADNLVWTLPLRLKYSDGGAIRTKSVLLDNTSMEVDLGAGAKWIMPDAGDDGYYRWSVPVDMLQQIASDPIANLTDVERASFLGNVAALLRAGLIGGNDYLGILGGFATNRAEDIVSAVLNNVGTVRAAFVPDESAASFAHYVRETLRPALDSYGLQARENESPTVAELRSRLFYWLGKYGHDKELRAYASRVANDYMADPSKVDATIARNILRVAAIEGDRELFDKFKAQFEKAQSPILRRNYLSALSNFANESLQRAALDYSLQGPLHANELFVIPGGISASDAGAELSYSWMKTNYESITKKIPEEYVAFMPFFAGGCSEERLVEAQDFFAQPAHKVAGTERNLAKVADQIQECANLRNREGAAVKAFLEQLASKSMN